MQTIPFLKVASLCLLSIATVSCGSLQVPNVDAEVSGTHIIETNSLLITGDVSNEGECGAEHVRVEYKVYDRSTGNLVISDVFNVGKLNKKTSGIYEQNHTFDTTIYIQTADDSTQSTTLYVKESKLKGKFASDCNLQGDFTSENSNNSLFNQNKSDSFSEDVKISEITTQ